MNRLFGIIICAIAITGCGGGTVTPAASVVAIQTATPSPSPTPVPTVAATSNPLQDHAVRIVGRLDELALLIASGDTSGTIQWGSDEGEWTTANAQELLGASTALSAYVTNLIAFLEALTGDADVSDSVWALLGMRNQIASDYGLPTIAMATPEPTLAPTPKPSALVYSKLSSRAWAKLVKAPDNYTGKGYYLWACITQFDAATGPDTFRGEASYKKQAYWYLDGTNTFFSGSEATLADFVADDIVYMKVVSLGSYSYDTQSGGNTTVPMFEVRSISRKGSCS